MRNELLRLDSCCVSRDSKALLNAITFHVYKGETLGILGWSGAEKSAFIDALTGKSPFDSGFIYFDEELLTIKSQMAAAFLGIRVIQGSNRVIDNLTIAENITLGRERGVFINPRNLKRKIRTYLDYLELNDMNPDTLAGDLTLPQKALIEIAMILYTRPSIVIIDQARLHNIPNVQLNKIISRFNQEEISVLYFTHDIDNAYFISNRYLLIQDGCVIVSTEKKQHPKEALFSILKTENSSLKSTPYTKAASPRMEVINLQGTGIEHAEFSLNSGEILGILDCDGNNKTELLNMIYGISSVKSGAIIINNKELKLNSIAASRRSGILYVPMFSEASGMISCLSVRENLTLSALKRLCRFGLIHKPSENIFANTIIHSTACEKASLSSPSYSLSEGLRQNMLITRALTESPQILILDEPFISMDSYSKNDIVNRIKKAAERELSVIIASDDIEELSSVCDRIIQIKKGHLEKELPV